MGREVTTTLGKNWDNEPMDMNHNIVTILGICTEIQTTCMVVSQIGGHMHTQIYGKVNEQYWLVILTILKNISQWEGLSHISWKIKHDPNHQPEYDCNDEPWENGVPYFETKRRGSCTCSCRRSLHWNASELKTLGIASMIWMIPHHHMRLASFGSHSIGVGEVPCFVNHHVFCFKRHSS